MPTTTSSRRERIAGLDGLRAIAVIGVLLYHADVTWARGGFIGVDVFFVLSGYLVASIVLSSVARTGTLDRKRFWTARLRRLEPAQITLIATVTLVTAIAFRSELHALRGQVIAALTGTTNWYLVATQQSYFDQVGRPPVLRHLWSLAIELQFYLVFPPILLLTLKRGSKHLGRLAAGLAIAIVASTIYMAILWHPNTDPTRAYFDTFARLAAPLTGALLALLWRPDALRRSPAGQLGAPVSLAGVGALVGVLAIMHSAGDRSAFMYHGGFLLTALLSAVVIAAITHPAGILGSRRALGHPVLVAIGLRSYGLYLWHWPVFVLLRPRIDVGWSWGTTFVVRILLTVVLTELCYQLVERPWHERRPTATFAEVRRRLLQPAGIPTGQRLGALGGTFAVVIAGIIVILPHQRHDAIGDSLRAGQAALAAAPRPTTAASGSASSGSSAGQAAGGESASGAKGAAGSTTTTLPASKAPVTLVGDSVMVGAAPDVMAAFGDRANIDAKVSRQAADIPPILRSLAAQNLLAPTVVVQLGINGTVTEDDLDAIVDAVDGRRLYLINARVPRSWEEGNNALLATRGAKLPRTRIIDWYRESNDHRDWFLSDGVHLTAPGRAAYAGLIERTVDA